MNQLATNLERRVGSRLRRRLPCKLLFDGICHRGVLRDFSTRGFFVESDAALPLGAGVVVAFDAAEGKRFVMEASVPHRRSNSRSLVGLAANGVGLRLDSPPTAYRDWVEISNSRRRRHPA